MTDLEATVAKLERDVVALEGRCEKLVQRLASPTAMIHILSIRSERNRLKTEAARLKHEVQDVRQELARRALWERAASLQRDGSRTLH